MIPTALIVVDVQRDFCEGGALAAWDTPSLMKPLQECIDAARRGGTKIVYTRDWHPPNHSSFQVNGGPWPVHCVSDTPGAELMPPLTADMEDILIHKGVEVAGAGYSGFDSTDLAARLRELKIGRVSVAGIATEYCVRATALDANRAGLETILLTDLIRPVQESATSTVLSELGAAGVQLMPSGRWLTLLKK
jgi:nicotinamidase/pyrazinamidase